MSHMSMHKHMHVQKVKSKASIIISSSVWHNKNQNQDQDQTQTKTNPKTKPKTEPKQNQKTKLSFDWAKLSFFLYVSNLIPELIKRLFDNQRLVSYVSSNHLEQLSFFIDFIKVNWA